MADPGLAAQRARKLSPAMFARPAAAGLCVAVIVLSSSCSRSSEPLLSDCNTFAPRGIGPKTTATPRMAPLGQKWAGGRRFEHVLLIVLENQDYDDVVREPYFRALAQRGALFTHYQALFHPSYPNYLALIGGKYFETRGDEQSDIPRDERTIADLLEAKRLTWTQYAEGYPGNCFRGSEAQESLYARKHVPFLSFDSVAENPVRCARVVPAKEFDRARLPNFGFYSPDMCHDGHDLCGTLVERAGGAARRFPGARRLGILPPKLEQSAKWLRASLEPILADARVMNDTLVVVTFDEALSDSHNHIYTLFLGGMVRTGARSDRCVDHYDLLRTVEDNFGLGTLGAEDSRSDPISDVWRNGR
jgi:hypothetical protein